MSLQTPDEARDTIFDKSEEEAGQGPPFHVVSLVDQQANRGPGGQTSLASTQTAMPTLLRG